MILPLLIPISLVAQVGDSVYKIHTTELKAVDAIAKNEREQPGKKSVNACIIVCYHDTSIIPIGVKPCNFIAIVSDGLKSNQLSVKYVSFGASDAALTNMKSVIVKVGSGLPLSKFTQMTRFNIPRPKGWGDELIVDSLLNSSIRKSGKYNYSVDTGSLYYVGIDFKNKNITTFEWEQMESDWNKVKGFVEPIANAIYKHASK